MRTFHLLQHCCSLRACQTKASSALASGGVGVPPALPPSDPYRALGHLQRAAEQGGAQLVKSTGLFTHLIGRNFHRITSGAGKDVGKWAVVFVSTGKSVDGQCLGKQPGRSYYCLECTRPLTVLFCFWKHVNVRTRVSGRSLKHCGRARQTSTSG